MSATRDRPATRAAPKPAPVREYVVLAAPGDDREPGTFTLVGTGRGVNDIDAIKDATAGMSAAERSRPFVAIARSRFNVRSRKVETVERESWS